MSKLSRQRSNDYQSLVTEDESENAPILIETRKTLPKKAESTICEFLFLFIYEEMSNSINLLV
jgi:hypothetical protein